MQAGTIVTVLMLLIFYTSSIFLFVGTCLCGLFLSSIFPCMLAYTEDILDYQGIIKSLRHSDKNTVMRSKDEEINCTFLYIGCATSVLVTSAGMGEMVIQVVVGSVSLINAFLFLE